MQTEAIKLVLDAIAMPTVAVDAFEQIIAMNKEGEALFGAHALNRNYKTMMRQPSVFETIEKTLLDGKDRDTSFQSTVNGTATSYDVSCRAVRPDPQFPLSHVILCFKDVTDINQAGQMRRDFVANVSHELRTPLTAMIGFIETLAGPARDDPKARDRFLPIMQGEAQRMNRLVGELLSLSRVEVDERVKPRDLICLNSVLRETLDALNPLAEKDGITIEAELPEKPLNLTGDADQLRQVFTNLIENAIKYGGEGKNVTLRMSISERDDVLRGPGCRVDVIDYGAGIAAIHLPRLTERFYRVDDHRSRELGGTGLGLAIVKHIINRHRGEMRISSTVGQGTTVSVILPVEASALR